LAQTKQAVPGGPSQAKGSEHAIRAGTPLAALPYRLSIDIGGTFTDSTLIDDRTGAIWAAKALTTHDPEIGALRAAEMVLGEASVGLAEVGTIVHATTLVPNAVLQRRGARIGLLTNAGFEDMAEMAREVRYDTLNHLAPLVTPLVERRLCGGVDGRMLADGTEYKPLDAEGLRALLRGWQDEGLEALAICFLHSYRNPAHEKQAEEIVHEVFGADFPVSLSSEVACEIREYERASTTLVNAYTQPLIGRYLAILETAFRDRGYRGRLYVMFSAGGIATTVVASRFPSRMVESGPVAGVIAAAHIARSLDLPSVVAVDVGGTTAKACLIRSGLPSRAAHLEVARTARFAKGSGLPVLLPSVDLIEVGAGGGSIAYLDALDLLHVGPRSAESRPGPACYGQGGTEPTVTDANVVLGYLDPDTFAGGSLRLDVGRAREAFRPIAKKLGITVEDCALAVNEMIGETMADATRVHLAEHGEDPRRTVLVASGGGGPLHAGLIARKLGIRRVVVPARAGVLSAIGLLASPPAMELVRSEVARLDEGANWTRLEELVAEMERQAVSLLVEAGVAVDDIVLSRMADMRWVGQTHTVTAAVPGDLRLPDAKGALIAAFDRECARIYGSALEHTTLEALIWRISASGPAPDISFGMGSVAGGDPIRGTRAVRFRDHGLVEATVYDRYALAAGFSGAGPAVVEERESSVLVAPQDRFSIDATGNLVIAIGVDSPASGTSGSGQRQMENAQ
jgi:N-methylhydantoinase A/oxoprolinase/acetone carboxylase beta subunit